MKTLFEIVQEYIGLSFQMEVYSLILASFLAYWTTVSLEINMVML